MEGLVGTGLDVPVIPNSIEVPLVDITPFNGSEGSKHAVDAEQLGDTRRVTESQRLRKVTDITDGIDLPGGRGEDARDQTQQGGLPGTVAADETGTTGSEGPIQTVESDCAIGPLERQISECDGGFHRHE